MQRRKFLAASLASSAAAMLGGTEMRAEHTREFYQLRRYFLQSGPQQKLTESYLSSALIPAIAHATGVKTFTLAVLSGGSDG